MKYGSFLVLLLSLLVSCRNYHDYNEKELYHDYRITAEEGAGQVSVLVQFKKRNSFGEAIELSEGSSIELDGESLILNRQKLTDPIYVAAPQLQGFEGRHSFIFTDLQGKKWKREIDFPMFHLPEGAVFSASSDGNAFVIRILADSSLKQLRVMMTDTSYAGKEFNKIVPLVNGELFIRSSEMQGLRSGPIQLELIAEKQRRLNGDVTGRGSISASYTLRREFNWEGGDTLSRKP